MFVVDSLLHWCLGGVRLLPRLVVVIVAIVALWPCLIRPLRAGGAALVGLCGVLLVDSVPVVSSVVPRDARRGLQVGIGVVAAGAVVLNLAPGGVPRRR